MSAVAARECRVRHRRHRVGDDHLLGEAVSEPRRSFVERIEREAATRDPELMLDLAQPHDRAGDRAREEQDEEQDVHRILARSHVAA